MAVGRYGGRTVCEGGHGRTAVPPPYRLLSVLVAVLATPLGAQDTAAVSEAGLPPAGYGTLRQDDIAVHLETGTFALRVLPLDERVIRLLAPDSYTSLSRLKALRRADIADAAERNGVSEPTLLLVTFFGLQPQARFTPEDVTITSRNRFFRPLVILPITPRWSELLLRQRETATAIYLYENGIAVLEPFVVGYAGMSSTRWGQVLPTLDRERAAVISRAGGRRP